MHLPTSQPRLRCPPNQLMCEPSRNHAFQLKMTQMVTDCIRSIQNSATIRTRHQIRLFAAHVFTTIVPLPTLLRVDFMRTAIGRRTELMSHRKSFGGDQLAEIIRRKYAISGAGFRRRSITRLLFVHNALVQIHACRHGETCLPR